MNRHTTPPQTTPPYTNGHYETPLELSGVSLHRPPQAQTQTVFAPNLPLVGVGPILYALHRFHLGGLPLSRYIAALWLIIALLAAIGLVPGRWITVGVALALWLAQIAVGIRVRKEHYVNFTPAPLPAINDQPLEPSEKLPIYATGLLNVEGRYQWYSAVPGFYRTFATGEHALLCRVDERNWLTIFGWPVDETGMWYAFINPGDINQLTWGQLQFGSTTYPAIALTYRLEIPPNARRKQAEIRQELLYIASPAQRDVQRLYVDLLNNLPADKVISSPSSRK